MCERAPIAIGSKVCDGYRKKVSRVTTAFSSDSDAGSEGYIDPLLSLNQYLGDIGETPISKFKLKQTKYSKQKFKKITVAMKKQDMKSDDDDDDDEEKMIKQLKDKFRDTTKNNCRF